MLDVQKKKKWAKPKNGLLMVLSLLIPNHWSGN